MDLKLRVVAKAVLPGTSERFGYGRHPGERSNWRRSLKIWEFFLSGRGLAGIGPNAFAVNERTPRTEAARALPHSQREGR